jgi:hypothetical protein
MKEILTRSGTPIHEWWSNPSLSEQDKRRKDMKDSENN